MNSKTAKEELPTRETLTEFTRSFLGMNSKTAKEKAIKRIKQGIQLDYLNDKYSPFLVIEEAIDIAIKETQSSCEEKIKKLQEQLKEADWDFKCVLKSEIVKLQKENTELNKKIVNLSEVNSENERQISILKEKLKRFEK